LGGDPRHRRGLSRAATLSGAPRSPLLAARGQGGPGPGQVRDEVRGGRLAGDALELGDGPVVLASGGVGDAEAVAGAGRVGIQGHGLREDGDRAAQVVVVEQDLAEAGEGAAVARVLRDRLPERDRGLLAPSREEEDSTFRGTELGTPRVELA